MYGHEWSCMVILWGNKWNFGTTGNMGSIENIGNIGKNKDNME